MTEAADILGQSPYRLRIAAELAQVMDVRQWIGRIGHLASLPEGRVFDLQVVTSEAIANGIEHAASEVEVVAWILPDRLLVEITNDGIFRPGVYRDGASRQRGLGLPLMVSLADQVHVSRLPEEKTRVSLTFLVGGQAAPRSPEHAPRPAHWRDWRLGWLLLPLGLLVIAVLLVRGFHFGTVGDSQPLLIACNTLFVAAACLAVTYFAAFSFLRTGSWAVLTLGAGSFVVALGFVLAGPLLGDPNVLVTVHNTSVLVAGALFAASGLVAIVRRGSQTARGSVALLAGVYAIGAILMLVVAVLAVERVLPLFLAAEGYTVLREAVLSVAVVAFLAAALCYAVLYRRQASSFVVFAAGAFACFAVGLGVLLITEPPLGSPMNWAGRAGQWMGGPYLLAAVYSLQQSAGSMLALERTLHEVEDRYRALVNTSPEAILVHAGGVYVFANPAAARLFGVASSEDLVGQDVRRHHYPSTAAADRARIDQAYAGGISPPAETTLVRSDGTAFDAEVDRSLVRWGGELAIQTVMRDISDRKRGEAALRESGERFRALAEENERLYRQQLDIAETLQFALLNIPSRIGRVRLGHLYRSATEAAWVGGDFYDVFEVKDGQIALLIGDVSGHGIDAARTATMVKDVVHAFTHQSLRTHEVLRRTNRLLIEKGLPGFVTIFLAILDVESGVVRYSSAGHPEALLRRTAGDLELLPSRSVPLGVFAESVWKPREAQLGTGDLLILYTDGITEARRDDDFFGEERLAAVTKRSGVPVEELPQLVLDEVMGFSGGVLKDDVAILAVSLADEPEGGVKRGFRQQKLLDG